MQNDIAMQWRQIEESHLCLDCLKRNLEESRYSIKVESRTIETDLSDRKGTLFRGLVAIAREVLNWGFDIWSDTPIKNRTPLMSSAFCSEKTCRISRIFNELCCFS